MTIFIFLLSFIVILHHKASVHLSTTDLIKKIESMENILGVEDQIKGLKGMEDLNNKLIACGAYGCVYKTEGDGLQLALKIGHTIKAQEISAYKLASKYNLAPYLHLAEEPKEGKSGYLLTDRYDLSLYDYLVIRHQCETCKSHSFELLSRILTRLWSSSVEFGFYHGDLHLNNVMVGEDLLTMDAAEIEEMLDTDPTYIPIVLIDFQTSNFLSVNLSGSDKGYRDRVYIDGEWRLLLEFVSSTHKNLV